MTSGISIAPHQDGGIDWEAWTLPLRQFAQSSGLTVAAYDTQGARQVGPLLASRTAELLGQSPLWLEAGPGMALERKLVAEALADPQSTPSDSWYGMVVSAKALLRAGQPYGAVVVGWRFDDFTSPMTCEAIARQLGLSGQALWNEVRLEAPVAPARLATYRALLSTLTDALDRQRDTIEELRRVSRARDLFLATVSHEMRTPLSALSMRIEVLLRGSGELTPVVKKSLMAMRMHVRQEAAMVDDLIDAARTLTGQMSVERSAVSLGRIVRDAVSTIEVAAQAKAITVRVEPIDQGDSITIAADARRLQQVLWNLLLNAVKFTQAGGRIVIKLAVEPAHVDIAVTDNGQGIVAADLPHVFGAFNLQTQANATGLGLGLYIAKRIVELHGGAITAYSAGCGSGTTFTIRLPRDLPPSVA